MRTQLVVVGALARVGEGDVSVVKRNLGALEGVSTFDLDEPGKLGILIEAVDLDAAHGLIQTGVTNVPGILGVWPVSVQVDDGEEPHGEEPHGEEAEATGFGMGDLMS